MTEERKLLGFPIVLNDELPEGELMLGNYCPDCYPNGVMLSPPRKGCPRCDGHGVVGAKIVNLAE